VDRIQKQIELQARLIGELQEQGPQVNVLIAPEWQTLRVTVLQALQRFPEARAAVAEVLTDAGP
jgi:type II secretory pathway predicted ATPase ExeA